VQVIYVIYAGYTYIYIAWVSYFLWDSRLKGPVDLWRGWRNRILMPLCPTWRRALRRRYMHLSHCSLEIRFCIFNCKCEFRITEKNRTRRRERERGEEVRRKGEERGEKTGEEAEG
jgi:hypothetical protein